MDQQRQNTSLAMARPVTRPAGIVQSERWAAMTALFDLHYAQLVRTARLLVDDRETAEDVVMEAFMALHRHWRSLRDPGEAHRYLRSSVLNGARTQLRRRRVRRLHEGSPPPESPSLEDVATTGADRAALIRSIRRLPIRQREVLVMRFYLDMSEAEVSEELGIRLGSVKQHSARGIAALSRLMEVSG